MITSHDEDIAGNQPHRVIFDPLVHLRVKKLYVVFHQERNQVDSWLVCSNACLDQQPHSEIK